MTGHDVPSDEMRWGRHHTDPIDAVLGDESVDDDLTDVAAIVHDLRSAYVTDEPLPRRPALAAFTDAPLDDDGDLLVAAGRHVGHPAAGAAGRPDRSERLGRKRHRMLSALSGFVATLTGKVVLGTAVTAASVGGLHAADVVDVPALPDNDRPAVEQQAEPENDRVAGDADKPDVEGAQLGDDKQAAAEAFTDAIREWTDCVGAEAAAQGDEATRTTAGFDPRAECGDRPEPGEFGLTDVPSQAAEALEGTPAPGAAPVDPTATIPTEPGAAAPEPPVDPGGVADELPSGTPDAPDVPAGGAGTGDPTDGGTNTPAGGRP
ncbi:MAG: hypothetical protein JXA83_12425 [Acidimicrobiales bacterium]|nr:hypothetical protein [Acidimicrobiales bacterium]